MGHTGFREDLIAATREQGYLGSFYEVLTVAFQFVNLKELFSTRKRLKGCAPHGRGRIGGISHHLFSFYHFHHRLALGAVDEALRNTLPRHFQQRLWDSVPLNFREKASSETV